MGAFNSSKTRVEPVFDHLFSADPSGAAWLGGLLALGGRSSHLLHMQSARLVENHGRSWGKDELSLAAPQSLLEHLVQAITMDQVAASGDVGIVLKKRTALARRDATTVAEALKALRAGHRGRKWFVLEGPSRPDATLETSRGVILVEGKRTERSCTSTTKWMRGRSQLLRHMDAALDRYPGKRPLGLLIVEGEGGAAGIEPSEHWVSESKAQCTASMLDRSLPHRTPAEREALAEGILGVTTWQAVCALARMEWPPFADGPNKS